MSQKETNKNKRGGRKKPSARTPKKRRKRGRKFLAFIFITVVLIALAFAAYYAYFTIYPYFKRTIFCDGHTAYSTCVPDEYEVYGIDVSHHQGEIDWEKLHREMSREVPITFVYIKATEGKDHTDKRFKENFRNARKAGFICGAYHYFGTKSTGHEQAKAYIRNVKLSSGDMRPVVDVEEELESPEKMKIYIQELKIFLSVLEEHYKIKPIIYASRNYHRRYLSGFDQYPLWIAHYYVDYLDSNLSWQIWQCSDKGKMPGIKNPVDINIYNGSLSNFKKMLISE